MSGTRTPRAAPYVYDPDGAWDELYDTRDGQEALPPPPVSPRRRRRRRRMLVAVACLICVAGLGIGLITIAVRQVTTIMGAIVTANTTILQDRVDWPRLQTGLRKRLVDMAQAAQSGSLRGAPPAVGTSAYLSLLIEAVVTGQSRPDGLVRTVRQRAIPDPYRALARGSGADLPEIGALAVTAGPVLRIELPGDPGAFPSGVGLCLTLPQGGAWRVRLVGLAWPEFSHAC